MILQLGGYVNLDTSILRFKKVGLLENSLLFPLFDSFDAFYLDFSEAGDEQVRLFDAVWHV